MTHELHGKERKCGKHHTQPDKSPVTGVNKKQAQTGIRRWISRLLDGGQAGDRERGSGSSLDSMEKVLRPTLTFRRLPGGFRVVEKSFRLGPGGFCRAAGDLGLARDNLSSAWGPVVISVRHVVDHSEPIRPWLGFAWSQ